MIVLAIAIIGATVMPHNLYLHSALVQTRKPHGDEQRIHRAIRFNTIDTVLALSVAFLINAAILVLAAQVFYGTDGIRLPAGEKLIYDEKTQTYKDPATGADLAVYDKETKTYFDPKTGVPLTDSQFAQFNNDPDWIRVAFLTLAPLLGTLMASILFGVALFASGQSSTITGTLAGQVVMEGFMHWRIRPWVRRLVTRSLAIIPAILIIGLRGNGSVNDLLVLSQVVLAMQLPFAMFPLLHFTCSRKRMGHHVNGWFLTSMGWISCLLITALAVYGLPEAIEEAWVVIAGR
jgi:manganese transport protein